MKFIANRLLSINKIKFGFIAIILTYSVQCLVAQSNVVLNPSFEQHYDTSWVGIAGFREGFVSDWSDPNWASSDYYTPNSYRSETTPPSTFFGFEYPRTGYSYAGFLMYEHPPSEGHEYIQGSLRVPLQVGKAYAIESYVSIAELNLCISNLGFYFSDTQLTYSGLIIGSSNKLPFTPQFENPDSNMITSHTGWQRITGSFIASGGEQYLSIGSFVDNSAANTSTCVSSGGTTNPDYRFTYIYVDDVAVFDTAIIDTVHLCMNDSIRIGNDWQKMEGVYTETIGGLPIRFYVQMRPYSASFTTLIKPFNYGDSVRLSLLQTGGVDSADVAKNFLYIKNDTIIDIPMYNVYGCDSTVRYICGWHIGIGKDLNGQFSWSVYPNPANDFIQVRLGTNDPTKYSITIIDVAGREVITHSLANDKIDISALKSGMYFIKLGNTKTEKLVGTIKFVKD